MHCTGCGELLPAMAARCPKCGKIARTMTREAEYEAVDDSSPVAAAAVSPHAPSSLSSFRGLCVGCVIVFLGLLVVMGVLAASCMGFLPLGGWRQVATYSGTGTQTTPTYLIRGDRYRVTIKTWTSNGSTDETYNYEINALMNVGSGDITNMGSGDSGRNESVGSTLTIIRGNGRPIASFHYNSDPNDRESPPRRTPERPVTPSQYQITITAPPTVRWQVMVQESKPK